MKGTTAEAIAHYEMEPGDRFYLDGKPGTVLTARSTGYVSFAFDDGSFGSNVQGIKI